MTTLNYEKLVLNIGICRVNSYLIYDPDTKEAALLDPGAEAGRLISAINEKSLSLKYIIITHCHFDHADCAQAIKDYFHAPVCMNKRDEEFILDGTKNAALQFLKREMNPFTVDIYLDGQSVLKLGGKDLKIIETPGHTPGEISVYYDNCLFCGDTILRGTTGRLDLYGADATSAAESIKQKIFPLDGNVRILCGHLEDTDVQYEKTHNSIL